jgi:4-amino-4-deoxy-L-arabinose transferase-like glycosyltransferase
MSAIHMKPVGTLKSASRSELGWIFFWVTFSAVWFVTLGQRALIHPDEGRYAELSLAMLQSGDWITPRLNGILYFEKPALQYWAGAISYMIFGVNEFAARFWPALSGLLSVLVVGVTADRLWKCGHLAALVMGGSLWVIANSHFLTLDCGLMFFLTLTLCALLWALDDSASESERRYGLSIAWAAMACAMLSKGLVGVLIPGCVLFLYSLLHWQWRLWLRLRWASGLAIFAVLAAPWFLLVSYRNPGFATFFFIHEHFTRYLTPAAQRPGPIWYFVPILLAGFLPWTSLLPRLVKHSWPIRPELGFQPERFLLVWAAFVFVFFSISHSKLPSYILPMLPALAMLLANTLRQARPQSLKPHLLLPVAVGAMLLLGYPLADYLPWQDLSAPQVKTFAAFLAAGGAVYLVGAALSWKYLKANNTLLAILALSAASLIATSIAMCGHDAFGRLKSSKDLAEQVQAYIHPGTQIFTIRNAYDQTLPFYLRRSVTQVDYQNEFKFGQNAEPGKAIPTLDEFITRWKNATDAMAVMYKSDFEFLQSKAIAMKIVYEDARRVVVIKP